MHANLAKLLKDLDFGQIRTNVNINAGRFTLCNVPDKRRGQFEHCSNLSLHNRWIPVQVKRSLVVYPSERFVISVDQKSLIS